MAPAAEPLWLALWRIEPLSVAEALARFDRLPGLEPEAMLGRWRGEGLPTGHPLDGLLERLGWHGKHFESLERVHPLVFAAEGGRRVPLDPARLPVGLALALPGLARSRLARRAFAAALPLLVTTRPGACLRRLVHRGVASAAMVYHRQPIIDHFRRVDAARVIGLMEHRGGSRPFFFLLTREEGGAGGE